MNNTRTLKVFLASPSDLEVERARFRDQIALLNSGFGDGLDVEFKARGWEDVPPGRYPRIQDEINKLVVDCDIFVLALWRRWGQATLPTDPFSSYTQEEWSIASQLNSECGKPYLIVMFKAVDPGQLDDPGPQLTEVLKFRSELESGRDVVFVPFTDVDSFAKVLDDNLRIVAKGSKALPVPGSIAIDERAINEEADEVARRLEAATAQLEAAVGDVDREAAARIVAEATLAARTIELAQHALSLAFQGRVQSARKTFGDLAQHSIDPVVLLLAADFYLIVGDHATALDLGRRVLAIATDQSDQDKIIRSKILIGNVYQQVGLHHLALQFFMEAVDAASADQTDELYGGAVASLAIQQDFMGQSPEAVANFLVALDVFRATKRDRDVATTLSNLAVALRDTASLDEQMDLLEESAEIACTIGALDAEANACGNLARVYLSQGRITEAEVSFDRCERLEKSLERPLGLALCKLNRAFLSLVKGQPDQALAEVQEGIQYAHTHSLADAVLNGMALLAHIQYSKAWVPQAQETARRVIAMAMAQGGETKAQEFRRKFQRILLSNLDGVDAPFDSDPVNRG